MVCVNCNEAIDAAVLFCPFCGAKQIAETVPETVPETEFCKGCGEKLREDLVFCPHCGLKIEEDREPADATRSNVNVSAQETPVGLSAAQITVPEQPTIEHRQQVPPKQVQEQSKQVAQAPPKQAKEQPKQTPPKQVKEQPKQAPTKQVKEQPKQIKGDTQVKPAAQPAQGVNQTQKPQPPVKTHTSKTNSRLQPWLAFLASLFALIAAVLALLMRLGIVVFP